jgi:(heptosyl)LPS beta-1,4-glucosyltransferase
MTIAAALVVRNEAHRIAETLSALRPVVDEIVVVDQDSDDGTDAIVRPLCDLLIRDRLWGFSEPSRELSETRATADWIFVLDADEALTFDLCADLRGLITDASVDMYALRRDTFIDGTLWVTEHHNRLYRRGTAIHDNRLHTTVQPRHRARRRILQTPCIEHRKTRAEQDADYVRYEALAGRC